MASLSTDELTITECDLDGVHIVSAGGALDLAAAPAFCSRVDAARDSGHGRVLLDLTELEFCDSSGLRALMNAAHEIHACAGRVVVVPPANGAVARLFALTGASEFLPVQGTVDDGLAALGR